MQYPISLYLEGRQPCLGSGGHISFYLSLSIYLSRRKATLRLQWRTSSVSRRSSTSSTWTPSPRSWSGKASATSRSRSTTSEQSSMICTERGGNYQTIKKNVCVNDRWLKNRGNIFIMYLFINYLVNIIADKVII